MQLVPSGRHTHMSTVVSNGPDTPKTQVKRGGKNLVKRELLHSFRWASHGTIGKLRWHFILRCIESLLDKHKLLTVYILV